MQTSDYTYLGNENPNEETTRIILRGGALILEIGQWAALTSYEVKALTPRYKLEPGRITGSEPAGTSKALFNISDLADVAISGIDDGQTIIYDIETGKFIPGSSLQGPAGPAGQTGGEGPQGPIGPVGPVGPQGGLPYHHTQTEPSNDVTIQHALNGFPNVIVVDSAGTEVEGEIRYLDSNTLRLIFTGPFSFDAYLSL